jgi:cell division protein FtsB
MPSAFRRLGSLAFCALCVLLLAASALDRDGVATWRRLAREVRRVEAENAEIARENERLRREASALAGDPAAVERAAREVLGYVRKGEIVIKLDEEPRP